MKTAEDGEDEDWGNLDKTDKLKVIGDCDGKMAYVSASNRLSTAQHYVLLG